MLKNNLGYPRIGTRRQLKKACESYWAGRIELAELLAVASQLRAAHWKLQAEAGVDLIPCNDFSLYDQVLDTAVTVGAVPGRYLPVLGTGSRHTPTDLYFAMARGFQDQGIDVPAMEMTKWFDTNYHYIVPEFTAAARFSLNGDKILAEFREAKNMLGKSAKPVVIGPVSFLLLGKEKEAGFHRLDLLPRLLPVYAELLSALAEAGAEWVQLDEPFLVMDLDGAVQEAYRTAYAALRTATPELKLVLATYFGGLDDNRSLALDLPVDAIHIDLARAPEQLGEVLAEMPDDRILSLGVVDGRNVWKNDYEASVSLIRQAVKALGEGRVMIAPSCSLLHTPFDLAEERDLDPEIKGWMAFARQKLDELAELDNIMQGEEDLLEANRRSIAARNVSPRIHVPAVKERAASVTDRMARRKSAFPNRQQEQRTRFGLPLYPTTTIGSFPQTAEIRRLRQQLKKGEVTAAEYRESLEKATLECIRLQEDIGLDVLVHGEFERNDMVEYFGEQLDGFVFTSNGWVQSYGSRCVKPPVIFGDVSRPADMTVEWTRFAQSQTGRPMKGMLTGPVTILQWSFVRTDQPRSETAMQIALAIRDEVAALEQAGIGIIQIDEPAIREGLPLRKRDHPAYLDWAVRAFRVASSGVDDRTQIHTHMCYSEFNDIIEHIALMDADVITIETSRSQMELLEAFADFRYPNEIGPGVYDIHSPRIPSVDEMLDLLTKASGLLPAQNIWVNPDCGLKTRKWPETEASLRNMAEAARRARASAT